MNKSGRVFRNQFVLFKQEKGMLIFYLICISIVSIGVPIFLHNLESSFSLAALLTVIFITPILSDSLAGERERKTLESLLSTTISVKSIIWGNFWFCLLFAVTFFSISILLSVLTGWIGGYKFSIMVWQCCSAMLIATLNFCALSIAGIYASATSADTRTANNRISRIAYPLGLLLIIYFTIIFSTELITALITGCVLMLLYLCIILIYAAKVSNMRQSNYFKSIKCKKLLKLHENQDSYFTPKSQFRIVFIHELKYFFTLKTIIINFLILCFAPAIVVCLLKYYMGEVDLYYGVLLTTLIMPRTPTNLIAYSIGGEKAYKTGESLLATPLHVRSLFLAKSMIPILVSAIMLIVSSILTLIAANIIGWFESGTAYMYSADQLVLLFPVGIMSCIAMVFITGVLSITMNTPRQGLYMSSVLGIIFVTPPLLIKYLVQNTLIWSIVYFSVLLLFNAICTLSISDKINRSKIMSRL